MELTTMALLLVAVIAAFSTQIRGLPVDSSSECHSSSDCGLGECCVLGMMRYSMPQCLPMGQMEDYCREDNESENRTLFYPNGVAVDVIDVHTHVCPCDIGLSCIDNACVQSDAYDDNYIY